ncbi:YchJ family protein [Pseudoclavibacter sp. AY1H1]|uniref:YchJ family protein n=1 Tax=Pseudoclavibacter sp. AY1H1 TaxID=2080584 RepID=UPI000CE7A795|nr:YchJ family metal-binding protein [Pseudoclavibacter sp. AY1H1]PPF40333.1 zinc chelation protein SecC [Pseudoclavibacter sp. AY1H1]
MSEATAASHDAAPGTETQPETQSRAEPCPCGSGATYAECCGVFHAGAPAPTAEALMRSRYSAFARRLPDYLNATWDAETRPADLELEDGTVWRRLQIVDKFGGAEGDSTGVVEFRASYRDADGAGLLHERARFRRSDGRWVYVDGRVIRD